MNDTPDRPEGETETPPTADQPDPQAPAKNETAPAGAGSAAPVGGSDALEAVEAELLAQSRRIQDSHLSLVDSGNHADGSDEDDAEDAADADGESAEGDDAGPPPPETPEEVARVMEALLFVSRDPLRPDRLMSLMGLTSVKPIREAAAALREHYTSTRRAFQLVEIAGGYQLLTCPEHDPFIFRLRRARQEQRLTPHALVTMAIVAYKQPITRAEVDAIRGAGSQHHLRSLVDRELIKVVGRKDAPGSPPMYGTTDAFLKQFGLKSLRDLPQEPDYGELTEEGEETEGMRDLYDRPTWIGRDGKNAAASGAEDGENGRESADSDAIDPEAKQATPADSTSDADAAADVPVRRIVPRTREVVDPD